MQLEQRGGAGGPGGSPAQGATSCSKPGLSFVIHQNNGRLTRVLRVLVHVNGRRVLATRGRRITRVSIVRPAQGSYTLRIMDYTARRLRVRTTRRYAGCAKTRPRTRVKR